MKNIIDIPDFINLSTKINYQLSGDPVDWMHILKFMFGDKLRPDMTGILMDFLDYLHEAYGRNKRKLGTLAILHPIRTAVLLAMAYDEPSVLNIGSALLHDINEDLATLMDDEAGRKRLEEKYEKTLQKMTDDDRWFLNERIDGLTKRKNEMYFQYVGRLIDKARQTRELVAVKLADRLDNTIDMRLEVQDEAYEMNCYRVIFNIMFVNAYRGPIIDSPHPVTRKLNGALRLYQLYKNSILLSLLRMEQMDRINEPTSRLFEALAMAGSYEAQQVLTHIFAYHLQDPKQQRALITDAMVYCQLGLIGCVLERSQHRLDGLFKYRFDHADKDKLNEMLDDLYKDKRLMAQVAVAFIATFSSFIHDPDFRIEGIEFTGIHPGIPPPPPYDDGGKNGK